MRTFTLLGFSFGMVTLALAQNATRQNEGYVPDSGTAVKIAEAVLVPVCGKEQIDSEQPFLAQLKDNVWTVSGTLLLSGWQRWSRHSVLRRGRDSTDFEG